MNREIKINALKKLLEFSLLYTPEQKEKILFYVNSFSEEEIDALGKILSAEHKNRDVLDKDMVKSVVTSLGKYL